MIADRIRRAMSSLLLCELGSVFLSFSICYFAFYARLSQSPGILPYQPKNLVFFFIMIFLASSIAACIHFYSELGTFITHASTSLRSYFKTSLISQLIIGSGGIICAFFMFSARAGLIFLIYTAILCLIFIPSALLVTSLIKKLYDSPAYRLNILLVGINRRSVRFNKRMRENSSLGLNVAGFVDEANAPILSEGEYLGKAEMIEDIIKKYGVNLILFFLPMRTYYDTCAKIVDTAESMGVATHSAGNLFERPKQQPSMMPPEGLGNAFLHGMKRTALETALLRSRDILVSMVLVLAGCLPALCIGIWLFAKNGRPVIVSKEVVGKNSHDFRLYGFRTTGKAVESQEPTVPENGRKLRFLHLDAIPSLINLCLGELGLFGPKALTREEFENLSPEDQRAYSQVKPGLFKNHF